MLKYIIPTRYGVKRHEVLSFGYALASKERERYDNVIFAESVHVLIEANKYARNSVRRHLGRSWFLNVAGQQKRNKSATKHPYRFEMSLVSLSTA